MYQTCHERAAAANLQTSHFHEDSRCWDGEAGFSSWLPSCHTSIVFTRERSSDHGIPGRKIPGLLQKVLHVIYLHITNQAFNPRLRFATHPAAQLHRVSLAKASKMRKENTQLIIKLGNCHVLLPKRMPIKLHLCIILWKLFSKAVFATSN